MPLEQLNNVMNKVRVIIAQMDAMKVNPAANDGKDLEIWKYWRGRLEAICYYHETDCFNLKADTVIHGDLMGVCSDLGLPLDTSGMKFVNTYTYQDGKMIGVNAFMVREDIAFECVESVTTNMIKHGHVIKGQPNPEGAIEFETKIENVAGTSSICQAVN